MSWIACVIELGTCTKLRFHQDIKFWIHPLTSCINLYNEGIPREKGWRLIDGNVMLSI